jgi:hypothetical protein
LVIILFESFLYIFILIIRLYLLDVRWLNYELAKVIHSKFFGDARNLNVTEAENAYLALYSIQGSFYSFFLYFLIYANSVTIRYCKRYSYYGKEHQKE